jgi:hypothetical protein
LSNIKKFKSLSNKRLASKIKRKKLKLPARPKSTKITLTLPCSPTMKVGRVEIISMLKI